MASNSHLLRARWIFPVGDPPIPEGVIAIEEGVIAHLGSDPEPDALDLGNVAIIPGLVNAHTHLEFSDLDDPLGPPVPFADWIRSVIAWRRNNSQTGPAIRHGLDEVRRSGTTLLGEIATQTASGELPEGAAAVLFREVLGLDESAIKRHMSLLAEHFAACDARRLCAGISPHAPYSVPPELLRWTIDLAIDNHAPVAMHLAETREELQLLKDGNGPLVELFRRMGIWREGTIPAGTTLGDYLAMLAEAPRALIIHGNYLTSAQMDFIAAQPHMSVVYCPRTHAYFGHEPHPWRELMARGINVALGTDSRASNPDLNLWNEVLFLRQGFPDVPAALLLKLATRGGAIALGCAESAGRLQSGRPADLAVVSLPETPDGTPAQEQLLHPAGRILRTMHRGQWWREE